MSSFQKDILATADVAAEMTKLFKENEEEKLNKEIKNRLASRINAAVLEGKNITYIYLNNCSKQYANKMFSILEKYGYHYSSKYISPYKDTCVTIWWWD